MKKVIALILALIMILSLAACAKAPTGEQPAADKTGLTPADASNPTNTDGETVTLRMIDTLASEIRTASIQKIIDDYQAQNPNIKIELISPPTEGADQKVQQMLMSDEQLDIIDTGNGFQTCINNGWIQPLNQYLADWDELDTISDVALSRMTNFGDGETYWCVPYGIYQMLLFYRKDLLADAGIEAPDVWTFENIYEIGKQITDPDKGVYGFALRGGTRGFNCYDRTLFSYLSDDVWVENESYRAFTKDGGCVYRLPEAKEALEFYKRVYEDISPKDSVSWGFTEMVQGFMSGTCAILIQDNDVIATIEDGLDPELWGVGNIPIGTSGFGTQTAGYGGWAMTAKTQYPEETAKFIKFLSNAENNGYFCRQNGLIPIHTTSIEQDEYFSSGAYTIFNKMNDLGCYRISNNLGIGYDITATFNNDRDEYLQKYLLGEVDADTLLDYWASQWEKAVADQGKLWE